MPRRNGANLGLITMNKVHESARSRNNHRAIRSLEVGTAATIAARTSSPPIRAELSGDRRCSALGTVVNAYAPVLTLARQLIRAGLPPDRILEVYRGATLCFCVPLAVAARLTVEDSSDGPPRFRQYRQPSWEVGPPIAPNREALPGEPPGENNAPCEPRAAVPTEAAHG